MRLTDERGETTTFLYDLLDRRTTRTNPLTEAATFLYDSRDNLVQVTDPKGQVIASLYDDLNRLTQVTTPDNMIDLAYDPAGNLLSATDDDSDLAFTYDALNRLETAETLAGGIKPLVTLTSAFNPLHERTTLSDTLGGTQSYAYDAASRLTQLTTSASIVVDLAYDPAGRLETITRPNGIDTTATYDLNGRLDTLTHGAPAIASYDYGYDPVGNITEIQELTQTRNFVYDELERLIAGGVGGLGESYAYDALDNRTSSHLSASHTTDEANRLLEDDDFTYSYDALGRRIQKDVDGTVTAYLYDGEDIALKFDGTATLIARYSSVWSGSFPDAQTTWGRYAFGLASRTVEIGATLLHKLMQRSDAP